MDMLSLIKSRRSIRKYKVEKVDSKIIDLMLEGARWASSGLNNHKVIYGKKDIEKS